MAGTEDTTMTDAPLNAEPQEQEQPSEVYKALKAITEVLTEYKIQKGNDDYYPSLLFKRVPNRRNLPDYYQIIKEPSAISTLKGKIQRKTYSGIPEFVRDFALVVHNAQVYNRPNSQPVRDVFLLDTLFKEELKKLVDQGLAKEEEIVYPDLGEIPAATPEPDPARIKAVIKGMRKPKDDKGSFRLRHFERLPDKAEYPHYYQEIKEPIAIDTIKKKAKRKKYRTLDDLIKDFELMFKNAMAFNLESSEIYKDAVILLQEAKALAEAERARPDDEFALEDGRIPLPDGIEYKGEIWKVGDWIHIQNPNDVTKPIVAQIYRSWKDSEGQMWINACWYYRSEQTVHQYEKHFYPSEVVKTGQYRDHHIEEVIDRCFVMFFTRYSRGRPRNIDPAKEVYVCEARYNEEKHKFNKIKTWASCLPDEVRDKDYEMDLFDMPRKIKKQPSPLKHLLKDNDTKDDTTNIPTPQWGNKNAPPIVGGIYKGPRDENPLPAMIAHQSTSQAIPSGPGSAHLQPSHLARPSPNLTPQLTGYQSASVSPAPQFGRQPTYQPAQAAFSPAIPVTPAAPSQSATLQQPQPFSAPPAAAAAHPPTYNQQQQLLQPQQPYNRTTGPPLTPASQFYHQQTQTSHHPHQPYGPPYHHPALLHEHRAPEAYVLSDTANESIPKDIRNRFPHDDHGRILFFTKPPIDTRHVVSGKSDAEHGVQLKHTEAYVSAKAERLKLIAERKKRDVSSVLDEEVNGGPVNRSEEAKRFKLSGAIDNYRYLSHYFYNYDDSGGNGKASDNGNENPTRAETEWLLSQDRWTGRRNDGRGRFEDDWDNRLPG
ncbi:hypothetical protein DV736_g4405, partial [Chaetothyriales sp. CBS 134916]